MSCPTSEQEFTTAASVTEETERTQSTAETNAMSVVEQGEAPIGRMDSETKMDQVDRVATETEVQFHLKFIKMANNAIITFLLGEG